MMDCVDCTTLRRNDLVLEMQPTVEIIEGDEMGPQNTSRTHTKLVFYYPNSTGDRPCGE